MRRWLVRKFPGGTSQTLACKFVVSAGSNVKKEMGPVSMAFEIPMYNVSQLQASAASAARCRPMQPDVARCSPVPAYAA